jgi:hypothetical protein
LHQFGNALGNSIVAGLSAKSGPSTENGKLSAKEQAELDQKMAAMDKSVQNRMAGKTEDGATYTSDGVRTYGTTAKVDSSGNVTDLSGNFHINAKELRDVVNNEQWDVLGSVLSLQRDDELAFGTEAILGSKKAGFLRSELNTYVDEAHVRIERANALGNVSLTGITSSLTGALRAVSRGVSDNVVPVAREVLRRHDLSRHAKQDQLAALVRTDFKNHPLRKAYEAEVAELSRFQKMIPDGATDEALEPLAREANEARRQLGVKYKDVTPAPLRDFIYEANNKRYKDPLGPTYQRMREVNDYSNREIIMKSSQPNKDINEFFKPFKNWIRDQPQQRLDMYYKELNGAN